VATAKVPGAALPVLIEGRATLRDVAAGRCAWALGDPLLAEYHDVEWGTPVADDVHLFEMLTLEGFQAGLSWLTILRKRAAFRSAFCGFDAARVAAFSVADRERLMADTGIVRNRAKIDATISNARAFLATAAEFGTFAGYLAAQVPPPPKRLPPDAHSGAVPVTTAASDALSRDLKRRGFRFVGSTIVYSFMQAVGLVDDHVPGCFRYTGAEP
jgi:DNA-3-methyladenine glycosylase I